MLKNIFALLLIAAMSLGLSACGGGGGETSTSSTEAQPATSGDPKVNPALVPPSAPQ